MSSMTRDGVARKFPGEEDFQEAGLKFSTLGCRA